jgi:hypothetical protein
VHRIETMTTLRENVLAADGVGGFSIRGRLRDQGFVEVFAPFVLAEADPDTELPISASRGLQLAQALRDLDRVFAIGPSNRLLEGTPALNELSEFTYLEGWLRGSLEDAETAVTELLRAAHDGMGLDFPEQLERIGPDDVATKGLAIKRGLLPSDEPRQPDLEIDADGTLLALDIVGPVSGEMASAGQVGRGERLPSEREGDRALRSALEELDGCSRFGISLERLVQHLTGAAHITESTAFPVVNQRPVASMMRP